MRGKTAAWLCFILVIALAVSLTPTVISARQAIGYIVDFREDGAVDYFIEDDGARLEIIKCSADGQLLSKIQTPKLDGKELLSYDTLSVDHNQVYLCCIKQNVESNLILSEAVYRCDFSARKLQQVFALETAPADTRSNFAVTVRDGVLSYVTVQTDSSVFKSVAVLHTQKLGDSEATVKAAVQYDMGVGFTDFFSADNGDFVFTTPDGKIFRMDPASGTQWTSAEQALPAGESEDVPAVIQSQTRQPTSQTNDQLAGVTVCDAVQIYPDEGSTASITGVTSDDAHTLYFIDRTTESYNAYDLADGKLSPAAVSLNTGEGQPALSELRNVHFTDSARLTASAYRDGHGILLAITGEGAAELKSIAKPGGQLAVQALLLFAGVWLLALVLYLLRGLLLVLTGGIIPVVTKLILACVPIVLAGMILLGGVMSSLFTNQLAEAQYKELYLISRQQENGLLQLMDQIDLTKPYDDPEYYALRQLLNALPHQSTIYASRAEGGKAQQVYDIGYHWLFRLDGTRLVSVFCDQGYLNIPIEYYYDKSTASVFYEAARTGNTQKSAFRDAWGEWIVLAIPVTDPDGKVIGVMETGCTRASFEYAVHRDVVMVNTVNLAIFLLLIVVLTVLIAVTLRPLNWLKKSVLAVTEGKHGTQTRVRGKDEVAEIGTVFNQMSLSVKFHVDELNQLNEGYFKFVPSRMFQLLRKSSVIDVKKGDQVHKEISILSFNAVEFEKIISTMDSVRMFDLINSIYSRMVPAVTDNKGVIDRFENAGLIAFFAEDQSCDEALTAAVSVCKLTEQANEQELFGGGIAVRMTCGISYGPVMIGIVGHQQRLAATTISEYTNLSSFLQSVGPKYSAKILIMESALKRIPSFNARYHARCVGFLHLSLDDRVEKFYDVYDGDDQASRWAKSQTGELFEKGLELYWEKRFYDARLMFIEVLKKNRGDGAAKEYLYRCDQYYQMETADSVDVFIEEY
jgi:class 3 adenylate cyclase